MNTQDRKIDNEMWLFVAMFGTLLVLLCCMSCTSLPVAMPGNVVAHATMVGGKGVLAYDAQGRPIYTYNNQDSLQHAFQFGGVLVGGVAGAVIQKSKDTLSATQAMQQTAQLKNASDAVTAQAQISASAAAKAGQQANFGKLIDAGTFGKGLALPIPAKTGTK